MTQDEIIRSPIGREQLVALAREAGFSINDGIVMGGASDLEAFAALVAAHEREACAKESLEVLENLRKETIAQCQQGMIEAYKLGQSEEREACAKVCEDDMGWLDNGGGELCAAAIRARGENER